MPKYRIGVREVHVATYEIKAKDQDEALYVLDSCLGDEISLEYSHSLDPDTWDIEEIKPAMPICQICEAEYRSDREPYTCGVCDECAEIEGAIAESNQAMEGEQS